MGQAELCLRGTGELRPVGIKLVEGTIVVGRDPSCDLVLSDISVSRRHAEIVINGRSVTVCDLDSMNGTHVGEKRVQSQAIQPGEQVRFGSVSFVVATNSLDSGLSNSDIETERVDDASSTANTNLVGLLSPAQYRVFELLLEGIAEKQIALQLQISRHTVHNHVRRIYSALRVHSRSELLVQFLAQRDNDESHQ